MKRTLIFILMAVVSSTLIHGSIYLLIGTTVSISWSIIIGILQYPLIDYYTFKSVQDSLIGKNYRVLINDKLYMNSIFERKAQVTVTQTDSLIHTTTTIRKSADGLYLGAETNLNYIGPDLMFIKGKWSYGGNIKFDPSTGFKAKEVNLRANYRLFGK